MTTAATVLGIDMQRLAQLIDSGQVLQAEVLCRSLLRSHPDLLEVTVAAARLAALRGDNDELGLRLQQAVAWAPERSDLQIGLIDHWIATGQEAAARERLSQLTATQERAHPELWLRLGWLLERHGSAVPAAQAYWQAVRRAQKLGLWRDGASTPAAIRPIVLRAIEYARATRSAQLKAVLDAQRSAFGRDELQRVDRALAAHLDAAALPPADPRQRPTFFYFPGLPDLPYHDPFLHPWTRSLCEAYPEIRAEASALMLHKAPFENFLRFKPGDRVADYVGGDGPKPAWDAFFFYRHGHRYDANHLQCPATSRVLESIELCRIERQAPEVCFSLLASGSHIKPHHGVTNIRLVMHLPLIVPADCALNVVDAGEHAWREGVPMMFDDTFRHEAWNRSDQTRVILLMDCWNPYLTPIERIAVKRLIEAIDAFDARDSA